MKKFLIILASLIFGILTIIVSHRGTVLVPELAMIMAFFLMVKTGMQLLNYLTLSGYQKYLPL